MLPSFRNIIFTIEHIIITQVHLDNVLRRSMFLMYLSKINHKNAFKDVSIVLIGIKK